jgi:hypothetical protein
MPPCEPDDPLRELLDPLDPLDPLEPPRLSDCEPDVALRDEP